jgi:hypothetical protein
MNFTLGSDPELFVTKKINGKLEFFPAIELIQGDKWCPVPIDDEGRSVLVDNVMVEFNTLPVLNVESFVSEHVDFLDYIKTDMQSKKCDISDVAYAEFKPKYLDSEIARTFGCIPDFTAYTRQENPSPDANGNFRSAAGHIHVGYDGHNEDDSIELIKLLDYTIGVQSVLDDKDVNRRKMYGKAGAYRMKDFGFEYRTLSNYWIFDEKYMRSVYAGVEKAFELFNLGIKLPTELEADVITCINTYNKSLANKIINTNLKK